VNKIVQRRSSISTRVRNRFKTGVAVLSFDHIANLVVVQLLVSQNARHNRTDLAGLPFRFRSFSHSTLAIFLFPRFPVQRVFHSCVFSAAPTGRQTNWETVNWERKTGLRGKNFGLGLGSMLDLEVGYFCRLSWLATYCAVQQFDMAHLLSRNGLTTRPTSERRSLWNGCGHRCSTFSVAI